MCVCVWTERCEEEWLLMVVVEFELRWQPCDRRPPCPSTTAQQTRHGCSQPQSSCVYQLDSSRIGSTAAAFSTVANTDGSRRSAPRSAGNPWESECNATQPLCWTYSSAGCRRRARSTAATTGSGGRSFELELGFSTSRLTSAFAALYATFGSAPRAGHSTVFLVSFEIISSDVSFQRFFWIIISSSKTNMKKHEKTSIHLRRRHGCSLVALDMFVEIRFQLCPAGIIESWHGSNRGNGRQPQRSGEGFTQR